MQARSYPQLFRAMNEVLRALSGVGNEADALRGSFEAAAQGFGAQNALLLTLEQREPLVLRCACVQGTLSAAKVRACERGESVRGVSPSIIRRVLASGQPELLAHPLAKGDGALTESLAGENYSVLCAPIFDPLHETTLAVMYFQNLGIEGAYDASDLSWLEGYAAAVGRAFGMRLAQQKRERALEELLHGQRPPDNAPDLIGDSSHVQSLRRELHETYIPAIEASEPEPILIVGERGTGKDLVARYLYAYSKRAERAFVAVNCAEITDELAVSRFFGHRKGSFTGAGTDEPGFFRAAHGGVLFLDEVGELSPRAQGCLLRVLESRTVVPVGETREIPVEVVVVLATNRDLEGAVRDGSLKRDFYDRFRTQCIRLLPLRERPWDIPPLLEHFRLHHEHRMRKKTLGFSQEAARTLISHAWPGNVRDLARACSLFVTHAKAGAWIDHALIGRHYPEALLGSKDAAVSSPVWEGMRMQDAVRRFERELILSRLERHAGSTRATRESLGLTKTTFHRYLKAFAITPARDEGPSQD